MKEKKKAHFIGLCGVGMSATAKLLKDKGWQITGSDEGCYPPMSTYLEEQGLICNEGYKKENIPKDADIVIIGKNAKLVPETNEEVREAYDRKVPIQSFPEILNEFTENTRNLVCAGSYGKSTCAALASWVLVQAQKDPSFFIGAVVPDLGVSSKLGSSSIFVLEGDEYPTSNTDEKSKFLYYNPTDVLLTSLLHDHVNVFPTQESYEKPFKELLSKLSKESLLVACVDDPYVEKYLPEYASGDAGKVVTYGLSEKAEWSAKNVVLAERSTFTLTHNKKDVVELETSLLGIHNIENIVGVGALLLERNLVSEKELQEGIKTFGGLVRRLDKKTLHSTVPAYEGFGSSYKKARAALESMYAHFPEKKLLIFFEPHTFSWRNKSALSWYDSVFHGAQKVFVYRPATQGSDTHEQLSQGEIVERIKVSGTPVEGIKNEKDGLSALKDEVEKDSIVLILTSGNMDGLVQSIPEYLEKTFKA